MTRLVLVIDDNEVMRDTLKTVVENEGGTVEVAENGRDALDRLEAGLTPGLILVDAAMPLMNGYEFLDRKSKDPRWKGIPVILLSTERWPRKPAGADEVLAAPLDLETLSVTLRRYLGGIKH